jgi:pimeloyl-ACP methyl ester carboxylesterase
MKKIIAGLFLLCLSAITAKAENSSCKTKVPSPGPVEAYASVNGMKMYYLSAGQGEPVILLHGAFSTVAKDFGALIPVLARTHRVIAIELQGHGHTNDIDRPITYEAMAGDVLELMRQLKIAKADFLGYSMGGGVALQLTISHPERVRHLMLASTAYTPAAMNMDNPDSLQPKQMTGLDQSVWKKDYDRVAPDTAHWKKLTEKMYGMMGSWKGFRSGDIKAISASTLLLFGDEDMSRPEHWVEMFRLLGGGNAGDLYQVPNEQLAVLPGTTHVTMVDQTDLLIPIVTRFLKTPDHR